MVAAGAESGLRGFPQCSTGAEPGTGAEETSQAAATIYRLITAWDNGVTVRSRAFMSVFERVCMHVHAGECFSERTRRHQWVFVYGFAFVRMGTLRREPSHQPAT